MFSVWGTFKGHVNQLVRGVNSTQNLPLDFLLKTPQIMHYLRPVKNTETLWVLKSSHLHDFYHLCEPACWYEMTLICGAEARCKLGYFEYFDALFFCYEVNERNWKKEIGAFCCISTNKAVIFMSFAAFYCLYYKFVHRFLFILTVSFCVGLCFFAVALLFLTY